MFRILRLPFVAVEVLRLTVVLVLVLYLPYWALGPKTTATLMFVASMVFVACVTISVWTLGERKRIFRLISSSVYCMAVVGITSLAGWLLLRFWSIAIPAKYLNGFVIILLTSHGLDIFASWLNEPLPLLFFWTLVYSGAEYLAVLKAGRVVLAFTTAGLIIYLILKIPIALIGMMALGFSISFYQLNHVLVWTVEIQSRALIHSAKLYKFVKDDYLDFDD